MLLIRAMKCDFCRIWEIQQGKFRVEMINSRALRGQVQVNRSKEQVFSAITKTSVSLFKGNFRQSHYLRWPWHFPSQVLSVVKLVGWLKRFLIDALRKEERATIRGSAQEEGRREAAGGCVFLLAS